MDQESVIFLDSDRKFRNIKNKGARPRGQKYAVDRTGALYF